MKKYSNKCLSILAAAGSLLFIPQAQATNLVFNVTLDAAHEFWTDYSNIVLHVGDRVVFDASGTILWDAGTPEPYVGPNGASWTPSQVGHPEQFQLRYFPIAALIGNIGGSVFGIGSHEALTVSTNGYLKLGINERWVSGCWSDNSGTFAVSVQVFRSGVQPATVGVRSNQFCFNITGPTNSVVVVEACTNLADNSWFPLQTNTLIGGCSSFSDPQWTNYLGRFYRLRWL